MGKVFKRLLRGGGKTRNYYGKVQDPDTKKWTQVPLGVSDIVSAKKILRDKQDTIDRRVAGLPDKNPTPALLSGYLPRFVAHLKATDCGEVYRLQTEGEIIKVALFCAGREIPARIDRKRMDDYRALVAGVKLDEIDAAKVDAYLSALPESTSATTKNRYRTSIRNLFSYVGRLDAKDRPVLNSLEGVTLHKGKKRHRRRALSIEELQRLLDAARQRPLANAGKGRGNGANLSDDYRAKLERVGRERALIYATAFYTGLRKDELRALRVHHLDLGEAPYLHLPGEHTKNGEDARLPLASHVAEQLRDLTRGRAGTAPVFALPAHDETLRALKKDLKHAGIPYRDYKDRVFDFHALRKCLGTQLAKVGATPNLSRLLMRHGDIKLTMQTYNDESHHELGPVVSMLPIIK